MMKTDRPAPGPAVAPSLAHYYSVEICLTPERIWVELGARHPVYGRTVWDAWGKLKPLGTVTEEYVLDELYAAILDGIERFKDRP